MCIATESWRVSSATGSWPRGRRPPPDPTSKADGNWKEADHMDGGASVLHMGVTVYGDRDMVCHRPGFETDPVVVRNTGGTVYFGVLTGPGTE